MRKPRNESRLKICLRTFLLSHSIILYKTSHGKILSYYPYSRVNTKAVINDVTAEIITING